ncbi:hypothetical protein PQX77_005505 [Marasmius sp. AFHP31]|nr:hypothetical protein PQX77_005505 [Marasmius sp. AFHP31]
MFPVSEFNFVVCGMATFAATVGYVCTKKIRGNPDGPLAGPSQASIESSIHPALERLEKTSQSIAPMEPIQILPSLTTSEKRRSLKRKSLHDEDEYNNLEYPYNLGALYPNKRSKTPPKEDEAEATVAAFMPVVRASPPPEILDIEPVAQQSANEASVPKPESSEVEPSQGRSQIEETAKAVDEVAPKGEKIQDDAPAKASLPTPPITPETTVFSAKVQPKIEPQRFTSTSGGFASFASSPSAFKSFKASTTTSRPAWSGPDSPSARSHDALDASPPGLALTQTENKDSDQTPSNYSHITGEEDEDVRSEVKGVKLFVKRGTKDFTDGMMGHIKLLSSRDRNSPRERLIFRREPLWQVMMNTRLSSAVRCTFEEEECILRVILAESLVASQKEKKEIVVYALKPGRGCTKQDFAGFARSVLASEGLMASGTKP